MLQRNVRDITERKRLEAERALLAAAVEQAADFVIVVGREGNVQAVNPAFERLTGYQPGEAIGRSLKSLLRSEVDPPEVYAALDEALRCGETWSGQLAERRADGSLLEVDLSVSPIRDAAGGLIGSVEIGRDRTRERELEAEHEREAQVRVALAESLVYIASSATLEQAAQAICDAPGDAAVRRRGDDPDLPRGATMWRSSPKAPRPGTPRWRAPTCLRPGRRSCASSSAGGPWARVR